MTILLYTSHSTSAAPWTLMVAQLLLFEESSAKCGGDFCDIYMENLIKVNKKNVQSQFKGFSSDFNIKA